MSRCGPGNGWGVEGDGSAYVVGPSSDSELHGSYTSDVPSRRDGSQHGQFRENRRDSYYKEHPSAKAERFRRQSSSQILPDSSGGREAQMSSTLPAAPPGDSRPWRGGGVQNTVQQSTFPYGSLSDLGPPEGCSEGTGPAADVEASPRTEGVVWGVVRRVFDPFIGGGGGGGGDSDGENESLSENDAPYTEAQSPRDHAKQLRPPTDAELRARRMTGLSLPDYPAGPRSTSSAGKAPTVVVAEQLGSPPSTLQVTAKVPLSLTPMQPPPDVLAAMKGRSGGGRRLPRSGTPPADVAAALEEARVRTGQGGGGVARRGVGGGGGAGNGDGIVPGGGLKRAVVEEDSSERDNNM